MAPNPIDMFSVVLGLRDDGRSGKRMQDLTSIPTHQRSRPNRDYDGLGLSSSPSALTTGGAHVAYRLAFDHPEAMTRLTSLDVIRPRTCRVKEAVSSSQWVHDGST
jgi:haloacetate dehalogenase